MTSRRWIAVLAVGCALSGGASAAQQEPIDIDPRALLQGLVTEEQVAIAFEYLRNALIAAAEGRDGPIPEALRRELDKIDADLKLRGTLGGLLLLKELEAQVKQMLRSAPPAARPQLPPTSPGQRT